MTIHKAWIEMVENETHMFRNFEQTGISLKTDESKEETKMHF